jgi:uncharacterized RDD family membrane protein YckC
MRRAVFVAHMFTIIGGDGKEYGPVTADQVRTWISAGRANFDTKAKAVGSDEWRRLGDYPEFDAPSSAPPRISSLSPVTEAVVSGKVSDADIADRGTRLVARLIDWVIEFACAIPGALILGGEVLKLAVSVSQGKQPDFEQLDMQRVALGVSVLAATWLLLLVVQVWMLTTRGQSIGKRIVKIRIVRLPDHSNPGIVHAWLLRELIITCIGIVLGLVPIIGPFLLRPAFHITDWCLIFRDDQRCLHDIIAGTRVVKA